ncbi:MAG: T9SS type A sorting domain-containing protein [Flavobacteriales bacterium]|nr:T9SS type A sorting domain-containing protein [Flavobacteriales bacterium]
MKSIFTLACLYLATFSGFGQTVPNSGFEEWENRLLYTNPDGYVSTNTNLFFNGQSANVTKVNEAVTGSSSILLKTVKVGQDSIIGGLFLGSPGNMGISGGYPFTERPDSFGFYYKSNYSAMDTAFAVVFFKNKGKTIGVVQIRINELHSSFKRISVPVSYFDTIKPDTLAMFISSGNPDGNAQVGNFLQLDNLFFTNSSQQLPNNSFENWTDLNSAEPKDWFSSNTFITSDTGKSVVKSTDRKEGNYSALITTKEVNQGQNMGFLILGKIGQKDDPTDGLKINSNPKQLSFWYKYEPIGNDSAMVGVWINSYDKVGDSVKLLMEIIKPLGSSSVWKEMVLDIDYDDTLNPAEDIVIGFASSDLEFRPDSARIGSRMWVDMVNLTLYPLMITKLNSYNWKIWPVPCYGSLNIHQTNFPNEEVMTNIYNDQGRLEKTVLLKFDNGNAVLNLNEFSSGTYLIDVNYGKYIIQKRVVLLK